MTSMVTMGRQGEGRKEGQTHQKRTLNKVAITTTAADRHRCAAGPVAALAPTDLDGRGPSHRGRPGLRRAAHAAWPWQRRQCGKNSLSRTATATLMATMMCKWEHLLSWKVARTARMMREVGFLQCAAGRGGVRTTIDSGGTDPSRRGLRGLAPAVWLWPVKQSKRSSPTATTMILFLRMSVRSLSPPTPPKLMKGLRMPGMLVRHACAAGQGEAQARTASAGMAPLLLARLGLPRAARAASPWRLRPSARSSPNRTRRTTLPHGSLMRAAKRTALPVPPRRMWGNWWWGSIMHTWTLFWTRPAGRGGVQVVCSRNLQEKVTHLTTAARLLS
mmetsp:Transcript_37270/g.111604  ORF Transcript_37270/g.111604 Transcript_37270/m.111604 type:complete len:332 (-) Transcript_37270:1783-2778(-)